jgi:hypothetical protein
MLPDEAMPAAAAALNDKRRVGVDPGRRDLVSCTWKDEADVPTSSDYSNKKYQEKIGLKEALAKRRGLLLEAGLLEKLTRLPSAKAPCLGSMHAHSRALFLVLGRDLHMRITSPGKDVRHRQVVDLRPVCLERPSSTVAPAVTLQGRSRARDGR